MPLLLIPMEPLLIAMGLTIAVLAVKVLLRPALEHLGNNVPVIGRYIRSAALSIEHAVEHAWSNALAGVSTPLVHFFGSLSLLVNDVGNTLTGLTSTLVKGLDHLIHVTVHEIVKAFVNPVRDLARTAERKAEAARSFAATEIAKVAKVAATAHAQIRDVILPDIKHIATVELPKLNRLITSRVAHLEDKLAPRIETVDKIASTAWTRLLDLENRIPLKDLIAGLGALTALRILVRDVVMPEVETVAKCRSKIRAACLVDEETVSSFVQDLLPALSIAALPLIIKESQALARFMGDELRAWESEYTKLGGKL